MEYSESMSTPKIHDNTIRYFLSDRQNTISILKSMLPKEIQEQLDLDKIHYEKDSFLPKSLQEYYSDLIVSAPTKCGSREAKIFFLMEHKSTFKKYTPLQFLRYILEFWDHYLRSTEDSKEKLPVIIPVLIAHPDKGWRATMLSDLVDLPSDDFKIYIPDFDFLLFDAVKDDPEDYEFDEAVKALFTIWRYSRSPDFIKAVKRVFELIKQIDPQARLDEYLRIILRYLELTREEEEYIDIKKIAETEIDEVEEYMGTIAEMFRREGDERTEQRLVQEKPKWEKQGELKATQETLIDVAGDVYGPLPSSLQEKIKSIQSIENLRTLTRKVYKTESLEEFTELVNRAADN